MPPLGLEPEWQPVQFERTCELTSENVAGVPEGTAVGGVVPGEFVDVDVLPLELEFGY